MKRLLAATLAALVLLASAGCGPGIAIDTNEDPGYELLFELPAGCTLVSESFSFTTEQTGFTGNYHAQAMLVTATYVIENDGSAIAMTALQPAPMARIALSYPSGLYYDLRQGGGRIDGLWILRMTDAEWRATFSDVSEGMAPPADRDPGLAIWRHAFREPAWGQSASVAAVGSGRLVYGNVADASATELTIPPSDDPDEIVYYSLGEESAFTFDYDAGLVTEPISFDDMLDELGHGDRFEAGFVATVIASILPTGRRFIRVYDLRSGQLESPSVDSAFSYELTLAPGTNTIVSTQPVWASCDMEAESCVYRFGFDEERYLAGPVPVGIVLSTARTVTSCTFAMSGGTLLFDATETLLEIDTLAEESVGSSGKQRVVSAVPTD